MMISLAQKKLTDLLKVDFIRFCIVGGTGFVINLCLLTILTHAFNWSVVLAQFISAEIALFSNFMLHHNWTYKHKKVNKKLSTLVIQFHATTWPAILGSTVMVVAGYKIFHLNELFALSISSAVALLWNFTWSKYVIWRDTNLQDVSGETV